mgnify:CR=1 FL=1
MSEPREVPRSDALFFALSEAGIDAGAPPDVCLSDTARVLCLMALSWRPASASQADARHMVHRLVEQTFNELRHHPFVVNRPAS